MEGGGAWSGEEEGGEVEDEENEKKKKKKKLLKKMSEYQASWFEGDEDEKEEAEEGAEEGEDEEDDDDGSTDMDMSAADLQQQQQRKVKRLEEDELEFPDEVQTPDDTPAKERFARYRALKSFRTSPWDPYESLPREYARIFKFSNFAASYARVMSEMEEVERAQNQKLLSVLLPPPTAAVADKESDAGMEVEEREEQDQEKEKKSSLLKGVVAAGTYVTLEIVAVSAAAWAQIQQQQQQRQRPLSVFSLLRYENKVSVLHFNIQKHPSFTAPLKSKERLLFYTGFRSFEARPVFSEHNLNCDKHKFSRYLHGGRFAVATVFGPVSMPPCPVLIFRTSAAVEDGGGEKGGAAAGGSVSFGGVLPPPISPSLTLVATGSLHTVDPDRIILKRILLTGYPVRVKRRTAVVKHMFYNPEDVKWFKPAELSTKLGAAGHIKEPIGTHGLMKMRFNRIISQSDTICLPLFKRVFPKLLPGQQQEEEGVEVEGGRTAGEEIK
jgi:pre-rRNA-processing protein TSR1